MNDRNKVSDVLGKLNTDTSVLSKDESFSDKKRRLELDSMQEDLAGKAQDRAQRKEFADKIFSCVAVYVMLTLIILLGYGNGSLYFSDGVLIALITTSCANVIGVLLIVVGYLFHHHR